MPGENGIISFSESLAMIRRLSPLVHNITNGVAMNFSANALLSIGASPIMSSEEDEMEDISGISSSLLVNIGTLEEKQIRSMRLAAGLALDNHKPWVLDPVGAGASALRFRVSMDLLERYNPTIIKGNASEILALSGRKSSSRGVDSMESTADAAISAKELAAEYGVVVAVTGPVDYVSDGETLLELHGGSPMMTRVTAMGCTLGSVMAAFAAVESNGMKAAASAITMFCKAGEQAASLCRGTGSMQSCFLDALSNME